MTLNVTRKLFTVSEYDQMIAAGIFEEDDRVELVGGEIVEMSPISVRHALCVNKLSQQLIRNLGREVMVSVQNPIQLDELSEPEPDIVIVQLQENVYTTSHPYPKNILLLIEVAETSLAYDLNVKLPRYAAAMIAETWIVDLNKDEVKVYRQPTVDGYGETAVYHPNDTLSPTAFPKLQITVKDILS